MITREQIVEFLWEHSYRKFKNGDIGEEYEEYPEYLADQIMQLLIEESAKSS